MTRDRCTCKWYNRCKQLPGCTKAARELGTVIRKAYYPPMAVSTDTHNVDVSTVIALGVLLENNNEVVVCPPPIYVTQDPEVVQVRTAPFVPVTDTFPAYEPPASAPSFSYDSSSYSAGSDYGSGSSGGDSSSYSSNDSGSYSSD